MCFPGYEVYIYVNNVLFTHTLTETLLRPPSKSSLEMVTMATILEIKMSKLLFQVLSLSTLPLFTMYTMAV